MELDSSTPVSPLYPDLRTSLDHRCLRPQKQRTPVPLEAQMHHCICKGTVAIVEEDEVLEWVIGGI